MMNCFCGMVDRQKAFSLISSWDHCQRSSPSWISTRREQDLNLHKTWIQFRLCWMKLCSTDNHYTTAPLLQHCLNTASTCKSFNMFQLFNSLKLIFDLLQISNFFSLKIRVLKVPFRIFDKLKNEIQKFMIRFSFDLNMKNEIRIIDYYFHVKIDFYFELLMLSFVFHFYKKWKTK